MNLLCSGKPTSRRRLSCRFFQAISDSPKFVANGCKIPPQHRKCDASAVKGHCVTPFLEALGNIRRAILVVRGNWHGGHGAGDQILGKYLRGLERGDGRVSLPTN